MQYPEILIETLFIFVYIPTQFYFQFNYNEFSQEQNNITKKLLDVNKTNFFFVSYIFNFSSIMIRFFFNDDINEKSPFDSSLSIKARSF
jgi:hypothetical protein